MEIFILAGLFILNGLFAMSEIAIVSSRKIRLQQAAEEGSKSAAAALKLANEPTNFSPPFKSGITLIGILSGAYGEAALSGKLEVYLAGIPPLTQYSHALALFLVVFGITYFSLIIGELVPKRLALHRPERIAMTMAPSMRLLAFVTYPLVRILSFTTDVILRLLRVRRVEEPVVTEKEIKLLLEQATEAGVFLKKEQEMVSNVLRLDNLRVGALMTPRMDIYGLDVEDSAEENRGRILESPHSKLPVCRGGLDNVIGMVAAKDLLLQALSGAPLNLTSAVKPVHYIPRSLNPVQLLEEFKRVKTSLALVVDEYGEIAGLVTLKDVLEAIVGDLPTADAEEEPEAVQREDGSWLFDGTLAIEKVKQILEVESLPDEEGGGFHTIGGFVMLQLGHVPRAADHFAWNGLRFEVVDMDKNRVDKVLVAPVESDEPADLDADVGD